MKLTRLLTLLALAALLAACGAGASSSSPVFSTINSGLMPPSGGADASGGAAPAQPQAQAEQGSAALPPNQQGIERLVIKTADLTLQVESVRDAEAAIRAKVGELGGYIVKSETSGTDQSLRAQIVFRVPAQRFDETLASMQGLAQKVLSRTVGGDDVTEEYVDLDARLHNLEATRSRLQTFLDKADKVEDALKVNEALSNIQGEIEQLKGRIQFLKQSAALSTVTVSLTSVPVTPLIEEDGWQPMRVARGALRELIEFGQGLVSLLIVLLIWTPLWLPLLLLARWAWRRLRAPRRPRETTTTPEPTA